MFGCKRSRICNLEANVPLGEQKEVCDRDPVTHWRQFTAAEHKAPVCLSGSPYECLSPASTHCPLSKHSLLRSIMKPAAQRATGRYEREETERLKKEARIQTNYLSA